MSDRRDWEETRERLLHAAAEIAADKGTRKMTLEHVAEQAGVSKCGLLYHFRTKEALLRELADSTLRNFDEEVESRIASGMGFGYAWIETAFGTLGSARATASILAAMAVDTGVAQAVTEYGRATRDRMAKEGIALECAEVICLAVEGLLWATALGVSDRTVDELMAVKAAVLSMLERDLNRSQSRKTNP